MVCPDMSVKPREDGFFEYDYDYCKGCGVCANECPADAIEMVLEEK
jgi:pyruvate ferredoxin oxidoreductase delta subunit